MELGATTLWERFIEPPQILPCSRNHHFWGDISAWFFVYLGGIRLEHLFDTEPYIMISPCFISDLSFTDCSLETPYGTVSSKWERDGENIVLTVNAPKNCEVIVRADKGYCFADGSDEVKLNTSNMQSENVMQLRAR